MTGGARRGAISQALRKQARIRAADRCEYCTYPRAMCYAAFHCDHHVPVTGMGRTTAGNLVWSCPNCNQSKGRRANWRDPQTGEVVRLFNPRADVWSDHFAWSAKGRVVHGVTAIGRATVSCLDMNRAGTRKLRGWMLAIGLHAMQRQ